MPASVLRRHAFHVVDDDNLDRDPPVPQLQAQRLLECRNDRRRRLALTRAGTGRLVRRPPQLKVIHTLQARLVHYHLAEVIR